MAAASLGRFWGPYLLRGFESGINSTPFVGLLPDYDFTAQDNRQPNTSCLLHRRRNGWCQATCHSVASMALMAVIAILILDGVKSLSLSSRYTLRERASDIHSDWWTSEPVWTWWGRKNSLFDPSLTPKREIKMRGAVYASQKRNKNVIEVQVFGCCSEIYFCTSISKFAKSNGTGLHSTIQCVIKVK
jgi:hypothetical protein